MTLNVTFLEPTAHNAKASKRFFLDTTGKIDSDYITGAFFTSHQETHLSLKDFYVSIKEHASTFHALLKGNVTRQITNDRRRGTTRTTDETNWIVFDVDGLADVSSAEEFMKDLGYGDVEYIIQYSASSGVNPDKGLSCHIMAKLDQYYPAPLLKEWLKDINLSQRSLRAQISLTKTNASLSWPLDITTCQNDKLIFISPPEVTEGVEDNFKGQRIIYHEGTIPFITPVIKDGLTELNKFATEKTISELREGMGLPKKRFSTTLHSSGVEVLKGVSNAQITGVKFDGEYVRINLNGGDSWAYYHPVTDSSILFNFKGEANYLIKELDPDYFTASQAACSEAKKSEAIERQDAYLRDAKLGVVHTAVRDAVTDKYYAVTWDHGTKTLEANKILTKDRINDFLHDHELPEMEHVPTWDISHNLQSDIQFDIESRQVNLYAAPKLLVRGNRPLVTAPPPAIHTLISHLMAEDKESVAHFYNWIASIVQFRTTPKTSWVLHGTQGTGKGLLFTEILAPLFGKAAIKKPYLDFEDKFNSQLASALLVFVDEVSNEPGSRKILQKLKTYITDEELSSRAMGIESTYAAMHAAFIFTSNNLDIMLLEEGDRRFNIPPRQERQLQAVLPGNDTFKFVEQIQLELEDFANFLHAYEVDELKAARPMDNEAKATLMSINETTISAYCNAIKSGDLPYLAAAIPISITDSTKNSVHFVDPLETKYLNVIEAIMDRLPTTGFDAAGNNLAAVKLESDDLQSLYNFIAGGKRQTQAKFNKMLEHQQLFVNRMRINGPKRTGLEINFKYNELDMISIRKMLLGDSQISTTYHRGQHSASSH